jgi:hypothetical protein
MVRNAAAWLLEDQQACCTKFFGYKLNACLGTSYLGSGKFYPDWAGDNEGCLVDSDATPAPEYMHQFGIWFSDTLEMCCARHYLWNRSTCLAATNKWYVDYGASKCVQDCVGPSCGGLKDGFWDFLFESKEECCRNRLWYINFDTCMA